MQFLTLYTPAPKVPPNPEHMKNTGALVGEQLRSGALVATAALGRRETGGVRATLKDGRFSVVKGPQCDSVLLGASGFSIAEADSMEAFLDQLETFMRAAGDGSCDGIQLAFDTLLADRTAKDEGLIHKVIAQWAQATGEMNADAALEHLGPRAVRYTLAPPLQAGDEPKAGLNAWFAAWRGPFRYEPHDVAVHLAGGVAFAHGLMHLVGTKIDGFSIDLWFRQTWGFERTGERWLIVHLHQSVPFLMDGSFKAAVELKP